MSKEKVRNFFEQQINFKVKKENFVETARTLNQLKQDEDTHVAKFNLRLQQIHNQKSVNKIYNKSDPNGRKPGLDKLPGDFSERQDYFAMKKSLKKEMMQEKIESQEKGKTVLSHRPSTETKFDKLVR